MKKQEYLRLADDVEKVHVAVMVLMITAMVLIFASEAARIYAAVFLIVVFGIELSDRTKCPLTDEENALLRCAHRNIKEKRFVPRFLHNVFGISPGKADFLATFWYLLVVIYAIISAIVIVRYFVFGLA